MANSAQARKRARQNVSQRDRNTSLRSELRTAIKHVRKAIESADKTIAQAAYAASLGTRVSFTRIRQLAIKAGYPPRSRRWPLDRSTAQKSPGYRAFLCAQHGYILVDESAPPLMTSTSRTACCKTRRLDGGRRVV